MISRRSLISCALATACAPPALFAQSVFPRIVSLDYGLASTLLSLGVTPVGVSDLADWDKWVVSPEMPDSAVDIGSAYEISFEALVQLKPDLILTTPYLDELKPRLDPIAEVLRLEIYAPDMGPVLTAAVAATRKLADRLGLQRQAEDFLARSDAFFDQCRSRLAGKDIPAVALVNFMDARHARIYSSPGLYHNTLERIGVRNAWTRQSNYWGFETIGIEDLSAIEDRDAHLIAFEPVPADVLPSLHQSPLWQRLPFAQPGHISILPSTLMFGMVNEAVRFAGLLTDLLEGA